MRLSIFSGTLVALLAAVDARAETQSSSSAPPSSEAPSSSSPSSGGPASSAPSPGVSSSSDLSALRLDFSVPDIPAFVALNATPTQVSRPTTARTVAAAIANGISIDGHIRSGLALEVSVAGLVSDLTHSDVPDPLRTFRLSAATQTSANTATAAGTMSAQVAYGARWSYGAYQPESDTNLRSCLLGTLPTPPSAPDPNTLPAPGDHANTSTTTARVVNDHADACRAAYRAAHLASSGVELAWVQSLTSGDASLGALRHDQDTFWLSASYGYNSFRSPRPDHVDEDVFAADRRRAARTAWGFQPTVFGRFDRARVGGTDAYQLNVFVAARLLFLWQSGSIFAELGVRANDLTGVAAPGTSALQLPLGVGGDLRVADGTWVGLYFGGDLLGHASIISLANLKWSLGEARPYAW